ncbi:DUF488 family protein [Acidobacteriota bacterium]
MLKVRDFFTIGYEGREIEEFISYLKYFKVSRLIDVREIPLSRKIGFSKSSLKEKLASAEIEYVHLKSLGSPKEIRKKLKTDHNFKYFFKAYSSYLDNNQSAIEDVLKYITDGINCIMCFEKSPDICHRSTVVNKIKEYNGKELKIKHI